MVDTITEAERRRDLALNILAREREVYNYQVNVDNYTSLLSVLPSIYPADLLQYRGLSSAEIVNSVPADRQMEVSDLNFRDKVTALLATEILEQSKARHIYNALVAQVDPSELAALLVENTPPEG